MVCPGLHSVFSGFTAQVVEIGTPRPGIEVWTRTVDSRFRLVSMGFAGSGLRGEVSAFHRFPPIEASLTGIAAIVDPAEFVGRKALVVGGSRGLGAVTAKLIVAGGGHAVITYARGARQAKSICEELTSRYGAGRCSAVQFEVGVTLESTLLGTSQPYTHIYYFASPRIFRQATDVFSASDFTAFTRVYIEGFYRLIAALPPRPNGLSVFYPSSIYVEKRPKQMTDYAMAKAAGEILCEDLRRAFPGVTIRAPRLPRILTDQTAVVPPVQAADAVEVMLPLLRAEVAVA
jgi:NADP-dependent 3-hydroxy acid dehydrogenase YdfG